MTRTYGTGRRLPGSSDTQDKFLKEDPAGVNGLSWVDGVQDPVTPENVDYTPTTSGDWPGTDPTNVQEALDQVASNIADVDPADGAFTPTTTGDWPGTDPVTIQEALDFLAARLTVVEGL